MGFAIKRTKKVTCSFNFLEDRHRKGSVIVISAADPRGWGKLFEDPIIAEAIVNRLEHPSQPLNLKGGSYREKLQTKHPTSKNLVEEKVLNYTSRR